MELVSKKNEREREALRLVIEFSFSSHSITLSCYQKKPSGSFSADQQVGLRCALEKGLWSKPESRKDVFSGSFCGDYRAIGKIYFEKIWRGDKHCAPGSALFRALVRLNRLLSSLCCGPRLKE